MKKQLPSNSSVEIHEPEGSSHGPAQISLSLSSLRFLLLTMTAKHERTSTDPVAMATPRTQPLFVVGGVFEFLEFGAAFALFGIALGPGDVLKDENWSQFSPHGEGDRLGCVEVAEAMSLSSVMLSSVGRAVGCKAGTFDARTDSAAGLGAKLGRSELSGTISSSNAVVEYSIENIAE